MSNEVTHEQCGHVNILFKARRVSGLYKLFCIFAIDRLYKYCSDNYLGINIDKTKIMKFGEVGIWLNLTLSRVTAILSSLFPNLPIWVWFSKPRAN